VHHLFTLQYAALEALAGALAQPRYRATLALRRRQDLAHKHVLCSRAIPKAANDISRMLEAVVTSAAGAVPVLSTAAASELNDAALGFVAVVCRWRAHD
jgi:hypothetical protein